MHRLPIIAVCGVAIVLGSVAMNTVHAEVDEPGTQINTSTILPATRQSAESSHSVQMLTEGSYRSREQTTYSLEELGKDLSVAPLPDPVKALLNTGSESVNAFSISQPSSTPVSTLTGYTPKLRQLDNAWITDIGILLNRDYDYDGHVSSFSLTVDADSNSSFHDVYLTIDIQRYPNSLERLHTSSSFTLYGNSRSDEYRIDIDLLRNFPTGYYDLTIELRDAYNHQVLDRVTAYDFRNIQALPLESEDYDYSANHQAPYASSQDPFNDDVYIEAYAAGGTGQYLLFGLLFACLLRRSKFNRLLVSSTRRVRTSASKIKRFQE